MFHDCPPEVSTITVVALTTATATLPGSRSSSRTASALINETTVKGPHCISTCAITLSVTTLVTSPTKRLRAELATVSGSLGAAAAFARANSASTSPAMTFRPDWSWLADRLPSSIQRRTLSSLTPNNSAASRTRINATAASYPQMRTDWSVSAAVADLLCLGELPFGVEACPFLARPDGHVDIGPLGPQRSDVRLLARCACERVPAKEPAGVLPGDLVDVGVVGAGRVQFGQNLLRRVGPEAVGVRVVALPRDDVDPDLVSQLQRGLVGDIAGQRMLTEHVAGQLVPEVAAQPPLVGVVPVAAIQIERDPTDAALGERKLQIGIVAHRGAPQQILRAHRRNLGGKDDHVVDRRVGRHADRPESRADVQAHHHVLFRQRPEHRAPVLAVVVAREHLEVREFGHRDRAAALGGDSPNFGAHRLGV